MVTVWPATSVNSKKNSAASETNFGEMTKIGYLAWGSATTHLAISPVNRKVLCVRHKTRFVSHNITEVVRQVWWKTNLKCQIKYDFEVLLVSLEAVSHHINCCQNRRFAPTRLIHARMLNHSRPVASQDWNPPGQRCDSVFLYMRPSCVFPAFLIIKFLPSQNFPDFSTARFSQKARPKVSVGLVSIFISNLNKCDGIFRSVWNSMSPWGFSRPVYRRTTVEKHSG